MEKFVFGAMHNTTVRVIHNSVRCFFPRSSNQRLTEFTIFYVTGPLLFCDSSTFLPYFAHDSPFDLMPDVTFFNLPFSSSLSKAHLSDPRLSPPPPFLPSFIPSLTFLSTSFLLISHYPVSCKRRHCQPQVSSRSPNSGLSLCGRTFNAFRVVYYFTNCFDSMPDQFPDGVTAITFNRDHGKFSI